MGKRRWFCASLAVAMAASSGADGLSAVADPAGGFVYLSDLGRIVLSGPYTQAESFQGGLGRTEADGHTAYLGPDGRVVLETPTPYADSAGFSDGLAAFLKDGLVGFIDTKGNEVLPPRFVPAPDGLPRFESGRAVVGQAAAYGWFKANGTFVESPTLPLPFVQGLSFVPSNGGYKLIDVDNKPVGTLRYTSAGPYSEGVAPVVLEGKAGWVDASGRLVLAYEGDETGPFVGGFAVVRRQGFAGLVDKKGNEVIAAEKYTQLIPLHSTGDEFRVWKFRESEGGPWGLVDAQAKVLAPAQWDHIGAVSEGLAVVTAGSQSGFITPRGTVTVPLADQKLSNLREGLAAVRRGDLYGYIDGKGKVVLEPKWTGAGDFGAGLAAVQLDGRWSLIDKKGKVQGTATYDALGDLTGKRRPYVRSGKTGFLDDKGAGILSASFDYASDFRGGMSWTVKDGQGQLVGLDANEVGPPGYRLMTPADTTAPVRVVRPVQYGLIDKKGAFLVPPTYDLVWPGDGGPTIVWRTAGVSWFNIVDDQGKRVLSPTDWVPVTPFLQGRALVRFGTGAGAGAEYGVVDPSGKVVVRGFTGFLGGYSNGAAAVQFAGGGWGFIDRDGKPLSDLLWDQVAPFSEGRAAVMYGGLWGYIDATGTKIIPYQYKAAGPFHNGLAPVTVGDSDGVITLAGQRVWP